MSNQPVDIFIAYAREDASFLKELKTHLYPLERMNLANIWYDGAIEIGSEWDKSIKAALQKAKIVLILLSADALASDYLYKVEMKNALIQHQQGITRVVPIILRPCMWKLSELKDLQLLPRNAQAINLWASRDEAYHQILEEIVGYIQKLQEPTEPEIELDSPPTIKKKTTAKKALEKKPAPTAIPEIKKASNPVLAQPSPVPDEYQQAIPQFPQLNSISLDEKICALQNESRKMITEFIYEEVKWVGEEGTAAVKRLGKWGYANDKGKEIIAPQYQDANPFSEGLASVFDGKKWGVINRKGEVMIPFRYDGIGTFEEGLAQVETDGKDGYINTKGDLVIPCIYESGSWFSEGLVKVKKQGKWGYVDRKNKTVLPFIYAEAGSKYFANGMVLVSDGKAIGGVNRNGETVLPFEYQNTTEASLVVNQRRQYFLGIVDAENTHCTVYDHRLKVLCQIPEKMVVSFLLSANNVVFLLVANISDINNNAKLTFGVYNLQGEELTPCIYHSWNMVDRNVAIAEQDGLFGLVKINGEALTPIKYEYFNPFCEAIASVCEKGKWGAVNRDGKEILPCRYDAVDIYTPSAIVVCKNGKWGFMSRAGKIIRQYMYSEYSHLQEDRFRVKRDDLFGFVNANGKEVVTCGFKELGLFSEGLCWAKTVYEKIGFIDKQGKMSIPFDYTGITWFKEGLAAAAKDVGLLFKVRKWGFIDQNNVVQISFDYEEASYFQEGAAPVKKEGKWGFLLKNGKALTPFVYDEVKHFENGIAEVKQNGKWKKIAWTPPQ